MRAERERWSEAVEIFLEGRYFEAHEAFEILWRSAAGADREFLQGWVLMAAALFHRDRGNRKGSRLCFDRASAHWRRVPARFRGIDTAGALAAVDRVLGEEWAAPELPWPPRGGRHAGQERSSGESP